MDDNLYLVAFKNRTGSFHAMNKFEHLFPDGIPLPFYESYRQRVGGHDKLANMPLGKSSAVWAMTTLSPYPSVSSVDDVKQALPRCAVMFTKALRLHSVRGTFDSTWGDDPEDVFLDDKTVKQIVKWCDICTLLIKWEESGRKD
ncbi:hypothetical protein E2562_011049 [Oryza meyeriana var. granulata]|uniref:rRNA N-glycosylase n=1 Tax=Oryza meyeriana var. granulata TaxID=110450 RepID=A0A6G1EWD6_9ORYZ|nr:hypothetical protein E2562_011049 [Oryza meyeriana var. granulata]